MNKIYVVRDQKIMLDRDLAELYGVETKVLKQDQKIEVLFTYLNKFIEKEDKPREEIGFKRKGKS